MTSKKTVNSSPAPERLSRKEEQVVIFKCLGIHNKDIARLLFITEGTVHAHHSHIYEKFSLHSELELIHWYMQTYKHINLTNLLLS